MISEHKAIVWIIAIIFGGMAIGGAVSDIGKARANAMKACYEAAMVNENIKCDISHD